MTAVINKSCDWIRSHFDKEKVNKFSIVVVLIYYYIGLMSYITAPFGSIYKYLIASSSLAIVLRAFTTALFCLYSLLVVIINKEKIQWKWMVVFIYILLFTILSTAISPQSYSYLYISSLYRIVHIKTVSPGIGRLTTMLLVSISDCALAFCFLFILPIVINNKKQMLILLLPIVCIGILECGYSIIFERAEYVKLFQMIGSQYSGYEVHIGATFGNKQDWGSFATTSFMASLMSMFLLRGDKSTISKILIPVLFFSSIILFTFTVMSLCKTAIVSQAVAYVIIVLYEIIHLRKRKIIFFSFLSIVSLVLIFIVLLFSMESLQKLPYISTVYNVVNKYIIERISFGLLWGRTSIWYNTIESLRTYNLFFGLSKAGAQAYADTIIVEGQSSIHNGFAYFFLSYGVFGFAIYMLLLVIVIYRILRLLRIDRGIMSCEIGVLACALIFTLVEAEVVIVSGANPIFIFNILLCAFTAGYYRRMVTK